MLGTLCIMALLFGAGGSALISLSFESSLDREKELAQRSYRMVLNTMSLISSMNLIVTNDDILKILDQLYSKSDSSWSALRLSTSDEVLYENGDYTERLVDDIEGIEPGYSALRLLDDSSTQFLQLSGEFMADNEHFYLDALLDVSYLYEAREQQHEVYRITFAVLLALCAVFASALSWFLTRPLRKLSRASREIASGNLSSRSRIRSHDEVGALSSDFDTMAQQVEESVTGMQLAIEQQERFMGSFAHELKTPMTAIIGYADLIRSGKLSAEEQAEAAQYIFSEGGRLESLSLKLLEIFVLEKKDITFSIESPAEIIKDTVEHLSRVLNEEHVHIESRGEKGLCYLEPDLIRSLVINLIDNARKATGDHGKIRVQSFMTADGCRIEVLDDGKGIPQKSLDRIAEAFYRVDKSRSRADGGVGLGLALCKKIVELHKGSMRIESELGQGTAIRVDLKMGRP